MTNWDVTILYCVVVTSPDGRPVRGRAIEYRDIVLAATAEGAIEETYTLMRESLEYKLPTELLSVLYVKKLAFSNEWLKSLN